MKNAKIVSIAWSKFYKLKKSIQQVKSLGNLAQITECLDTYFIPRNINQKVIDFEKTTSQISKEFSAFPFKIFRVLKIFSKSQKYS